tara:strand:- start:1050 stop:1496 length:447 start_codon:yes stop_codon:yes gene_type:complete
MKTGKVLTDEEQAKNRVEAAMALQGIAAIMERTQGCDWTIEIGHEREEPTRLEDCSWQDALELSHRATNYEIHVRIPAKPKDETKKYTRADLDEAMWRGAQAAIDNCAMDHDDCPMKPKKERLYTQAEVDEIKEAAYDEGCENTSDLP